MNDLIVVGFIYWVVEYFEVILCGFGWLEGDVVCLSGGLVFYFVEYMMVLVWNVLMVVVGLLLEGVIVFVWWFV